MTCVHGFFHFVISISFMKSAEAVHTETVLQGNRLHLICAYNGKEIIQIYRWSNQSTDSPILTINYSNCQELYNDNSSLYNSQCKGNGTVLTISNVRAQDHDSTIICQVMLVDGKYRNVNETRIYVTVPVRNVYLVVQDSHIPENTSVSMVCNTSFARPSPNIRWFLDPGTERKEDDKAIWFGISNTLYKNEKLSSLESTLTKSFNRSFSSWYIYCTASNLPGQSLESKKVLLNITYPPDGPPLIESCNNCHTYKIVENSQGNLTCTSTGGNPLPDLTWDCFYADEHKSVTKNSVTTILHLNASRLYQGMCSCESKYIDNLERKKAINIDVLYPPDVPDIILYTAKKSIVLDELTVVENTNITLSCKSTGNPPPTYKWVDFIEHFSQNYSTIPERQQNNLTCYVSNIMQTDTETLLDSNFKTITLDVQYPPKVLDMTTQTFIEHTEVGLPCSFTRGNPPITNVSWTRNNRTEQVWNSQWLSIQNVTKHHDDIYTCHASNEMTPTGGQSQIGYSHKSFHLNILYKTSVIQFYETVQDTNDRVVKTENSSITLRCDADGNPHPTIEIWFKGRVEITNVASNLVVYRNTISCADAGIYMCSGRNFPNDGKYINKSQTVIVLCAPRPSNLQPTVDKIATALHTSATFSFSAQDYHDIQRPSFVWKKQQHSQLIKLLVNDTIRIFESSLQTNLTISIITESDFGTYILEVSNSIGTYEKSFELVPDDIPKIPQDVEVVDAHVTPSTALIRWLSGFHGGHPQTFVIKYKRKNERNWNEIFVKDTSSNLENEITINGLSRNTWYEITMYAYNKLGRTNYTDQLEFQTEDDATGLIGPYIGSVAGSISGVLIVTSGILFGVIKYKNRTVRNTKTVMYENIQITGNEKQRSKNVRATNDETPVHSCQELDTSMSLYHEQREYANWKFVMGNITEIKVSELFEYVCNRSEDSFDLEYAKLPKGLLKPCTEATKQENIALNRYKGLYPYDLSRVKIENDPGFYINASYIHGMKCEEYWPILGSDALFGNIRVTYEKIDEFAEYNVRYFNIANASEERRVTQLHYTAWPDKTVPEDVVSLLEFRQRVKATPSTKKGPVVVHCSAGIGRTGTFIALDNLIEQGHNDGYVNVFKCVKSLREQRVNMVQTLSFKKKDLFIAVQSPQPETVSDFVTMIYQENCCCVVTMEDVEESRTTAVQYFSSSENTLRFGDIQLSCTDLETKPQYTVREIKMKYTGQVKLETKPQYTVREIKMKYTGQYRGGEAVAYHFQYNKWMPESDVPSDPKEFVQFIKDVEDYVDTFSEENSHVLVHCTKTNDRSALFCLMSILMQKIKYERQVSILNTVRHFRSRRSTAVTSMQQLKFCYMALSAYISGNESC